MVLIVDDLWENIISLKKVLEKNGFLVDTALSGEEALKKVLKKSYVLILLDVQMPGMDGFEVAEAISGYSKAKETAIIFLSAANTELKFITQGYSSGGIDYITKPLEINILLHKVKTFYRIYEQSRELKQMQNALLEEIEFRKEAERKKDEFLGIASHELKTPLTSIKGYVQVLERSIDKSDTATIKNRVGKVRDQIEKLNQLVADLLDISKIENGKLKFNKKYFSIDSVLDNIIDVMQHSYPDYKIKKTGLAGKKIFGDEMRIEQVIVNFISNAIKYSPDNNEIQVNVSICDDKLYVGVKDFGIGILPEHQKHLFNKFYRAEETSTRFQGLGIGLYISREIINRHIGEIGVNSNFGEGSEFYFYLPIDAVEDTYLD
jgi:signal transduction histidine kinase